MTRRSGPPGFRRDRLRTPKARCHHTARMDIYRQAAQLVYLFASTATAFAAVWIASRNIAAVRASLARRPMAIATAVAIGQAMVTAAAIAFMAQGTLDTALGTVFVANWALVLPAAAILPAALAVDRELRPSAEANDRAIVAGSALIVAISVGVLALAVRFPGQVREAGQMADVVASPAARALLLPLALMAAPVEEVIFRGGLQGFCEKFLVGKGLARWPATVLASAAWAMGHAGMMEPTGIKEGQIFLIGLVLGWVKGRAGLRGAVIAHLTLNGLLVAVDLAGTLAGWNGP